MAGFTGVCGRLITDSHEAVSRAAQATAYSSGTSVKNIYADNNFILDKSSLNILSSIDNSKVNDNVYVWLDGEVYNEKDFISDVHKTFIEALLSSYHDGTLNNFMKEVDGVFIVLIYDLNKKTLQWVTDRYGLKFLYLYKGDNCLIFGPELKCFPYFNSFKLKIRADVVDCFIQLEHFLGNATWFNGVELSEPSTIYTYSWETHSLRNEHYWSWSLIKHSSLTLKQAAEKMQHLFKVAVQKRCIGNYKIGVGLSGGYDSRAILAAIQNNKPPTYTFGIANSPDVRIAQRVAKAVDVSNTHFEMHVTDWLKERFTGVWKTDGMFNMYHMHYSHLMDDILKIMDVNLSGYLGDVVLGGSYLSKKFRTYLNKRIDESIAQHYYGKHFVFCDVNNPYFDMNKVDPYLIHNRGRRLIGLGMEEANKTIHQRMPFMDCKLMDFAYSLPDEYRSNGKVYHLGLVLKYPELFESIPNATTGVCLRLKPSLYFNLKKQFYWLASIAKYKLGMATSYTDVANWIMEPETAKFVGNLLGAKDALYRHYTSNDFYKMYFMPHMNARGNYIKQIMGAVTMEIWLQQIFNKKYL
jgi:asparagine synthase (glutamine-hydrolysing)